MSFNDQITQIASLRAVLKPEQTVDLRETVATINNESRSAAYTAQATALAELAKNKVMPIFDANGNITNQAAVDASNAVWDPILKVGYTLLERLTK